MLLSRSSPIQLLTIVYKSLVIYLQALISSIIMFNRLALDSILQESAYGKRSDGLNCYVETRPAFGSGGLENHGAMHVQYALVVGRSGNRPCGLTLFPTEHRQVK